MCQIVFERELTEKQYKRIFKKLYGRKFESCYEPMVEQTISHASCSVTAPMEEVRYVTRMESYKMKRHTKPTGEKND